MKTKHIVTICLLLAGGVAVIFLEAVVWGPATTVRGVVTFLAPQPGDPYDRIVNLHDPRLQIIADRMKRGEILDRNGEKIVGTDPDTGERVYPLGDAMGTLIGPAEAIVLRPEWMIERQLDGKLRGYPDLDDGPAVWMAEKADGGERFLFVVKSREPLPEDREKALKMAEGDEVRLLALNAPDFRPLLPLMRASRETLAKVYDDIPSRTARVTIDAKLQIQASQILKEAAKHGKAAAAVVLDADTGQVLARAQWPDFDPGSEKFMRRLTDPDFPVKDKKFIGVYGPWPDKTGTRGVFQAGSVAKVVTSLVAARAGLLGTASQRVAKTGPVFPCKLRDGQGPYFIKPGWYKAIHDHPEDPMHGDVEFIRGLAVSCNVYFGQLGLALGPDAFKQLVADGVEIGWDGKTINPGKAGSRELAETAFGQAAALLSVSQLARVGGTVAGGGVYRKCGPGMDLELPCEQRKIANDPNLMVPILSGMEQVVLAGTARGLKVPPGVRLYGKTGTADAIGTRDEIVFGVPYNEWGPPNSWFLGIAETAEAEPDQALTPRRVVAAVVVPRGGLGARTAGPAAMEILAAAQSLGYITKPAATEGGSSVPSTMVGTSASPAPGAAGAKTARPVTVLAPVLATPTPSPRPPGTAPVGASPAAGAAPAAAPPSGATPVSPAPAATPRPAASATPRPSAPATPRPSPSAPAAPPAPEAPSPSPPGQ